MKNIFIDREESWMDFNQRVLMQASIKPNVPLIERFKFLGITQSNLDEFISVRFSDVYNKYITKFDIPDDIGNTNYKRKYKKLLKRIIAFKNDQGKVYSKLINELNSKDIKISKIESLSKNEKKQLKKFFKKEIMGCLTPIMFSNRKEIPLFKNDELNLLVQCKDTDGNKKYAFIQIPSSIQRLVKLKKKDKYIYIEDLIISNIKQLFVNVNIEDIGVFKINRQYLDIVLKENKRNIVDFIKESLAIRDHGKIIFMDTWRTSKSLKKTLIKVFDLPVSHVFDSSQRIDLGFFASDILKSPKLIGYEHIEGEYPTDLVKAKSLFEYINKNDVVLHHPHESYDVIIDFLKEAANDPKVVSIKQTLYRVSSIESPIVKALCKAAQNGKNVTVMLELLARFDETQNLKLIDKLKNAGVNIVYTLEGVKTHCKMILVTRKKKKGLEQFAYTATGNFNEKTARAYTDISYFTSKKDICNDLNHVFNIITGYSKPERLKTVGVSPFSLKNKLIELINREIKNAKNGKKALIKIKVNAICDVPIMNALLRAADEGVKIKIICRGINSLPYHKNIEIHSVVGKYLEHSRIYQFHNNGKKDVYISSADLLTRNLDKRIELLVPVKDKYSKKKILTIFKEAWKDKYNTFIYTEKGYEYMGDE